jgi:predicted acyl esterase
MKSNADLDMRGTWMSEGDTYINSTLDGKDGYDIIEWIAEQSWSNKRHAASYDPNQKS